MRIISPWRTRRSALARVPGVNQRHRRMVTAYADWIEREAAVRRIDVLTLEDPADDLAPCVPARGVVSVSRCALHEIGGGMRSYIRLDRSYSYGLCLALGALAGAIVAVIDRTDAEQAATLASASGMLISGLSLFDPREHPGGYRIGAALWAAGGAVNVVLGNAVGDGFWQTATTGALRLANALVVIAGLRFLVARRGLQLARAAFGVFAVAHALEMATIDRGPVNITVRALLIGLEIFTIRMTSPGRVREFRHLAAVSR